LNKNGLFIKTNLLLCSFFDDFEQMSEEKGKVTKEQGMKRSKEESV